MGLKLPQAFYLNEDVVNVAKSLLGKVLVTRINKKLTSGMIVETEAYSWMERGCHAFREKKTARNAPMFDAGGVSYVYLIYGMYELFNVVTNQPGTAEAVLIRALEPMEGVTVMTERCQTASSKRITSGPGKLTRALGITRDHNRMNIVSGNTIWIEDQVNIIKPSQIVSTARIGLNFEGDDAFLPWRFTIQGNPWVSK